MSEWKTSPFFKYGESAQGNFRIVDTIGVPHPYCVGARHVVHAADHHSGMLGKDAIECGERKRIFCDICKGKLTFAQHEQALIVECNADLHEPNGQTNSELHDFLLAIKDQVERDGYAGFAFKQGGA